MGGSRQSAPTQTTQVVEPWAEAKPYLTYGMQQARNLYDNNGGFNYFPGQTVVGFDPATTNALNMTEQRAMAGSPLLRGAQSNLASTVSGDFLNGNQYLDGAINTASRGLVRNFNEAVVPSLNASFARSGRYGSGAQARAFSNVANDLGTQLGDISTRMSFDNYNAERGRQIQAAALAPQLASADYNDLAKLGEVGAARENQAQQVLNDEIARWDNNNNRDRQALDEYLKRIGLAQGDAKTSITTQPGTRKNPLAGAIGGGLGAAGMLGNMGILGAGGMASPWGWGLLGAGVLGGMM